MVEKLAQSHSLEMLTRPLPPEIVALLIAATSHTKCLCLNDGADTKRIEPKITSWAEGHNMPGTYLLFADDLKEEGGIK